MHWRWLRRKTCMQAWRPEFRSAASVWWSKAWPPAPGTPVPRMGAWGQENHWTLLASHLAGRIVTFKFGEGLCLKRTGDRRGHGIHFWPLGERTDEYTFTSSYSQKYLKKTCVYIYTRYRQRKILDPKIEHQQTKAKSRKQEFWVLPWFTRSPWLTHPEILKSSAC